ncbi:MAG: patatin-like phospholipase family protein [Hydrogenothermaceae bacterium]|nr:patatin-like phospholipase family protein [Hydrogenothermaceae bacterium]
MRFGIVLSGGAVRGLAHIGVLKALEEHGIKPSVVSGVSAGSIIGLFYSAGYSPSDIEDLAIKTDFKSYVKPSFSKEALFSIESMDTFLEKYIHYKDISELPKEFHVAITNLNTASVEYKNSGDIKKIVRASCSLPVLFRPVKIDKFYYIDGGVMNNLPVEPLVSKVDYIIGVDVNPFLPEEKDFSNLISIGIRSFDLAIKSNTESRKQFCNLFIQPPELTNIPLFAIWKKEDAIKIGYDYTKELLKSIKI